MLRSWYFLPQFQLALLYWSLSFGFLSSKSLDIKGLGMTPVHRWWLWEKISHACTFDCCQRVTYRLFALKPCLAPVWNTSGGWPFLLHQCYLLIALLIDHFSNSTSMDLVQSSIFFNTWSFTPQPIRWARLVAGTNKGGMYMNKD